MSEREWVLWAGTIGFESPLDRRFEAAAANGYTHVTLSVLDIDRAAADGTSTAEIRRRAAGAGLQLIVDPVMNWHDVVEAPRRSRFGGIRVEDNLAVAEALGAVSINAVATDTDDPSTDRFVEPFAALCRRAADIGARVHLEFIPMSPIADVAAAWQIVRDAGEADAGVLIDTWHFFRGSGDFAALESVPGNRISSVQIDDALLRADGPPWEDTKRRLLPGEG